MCREMELSVRRQDHGSTKENSELWQVQMADTENRAGLDTNYQDTIISNYGINVIDQGVKKINGSNFNCHNNRIDDFGNLIKSGTVPENWAREAQRAQIEDKPSFTFQKVLGEGKAGFPDVQEHRVHVRNILETLLLPKRFSELDPRMKALITAFFKNILPAPPCKYCGSPEKVYFRYFNNRLQPTLRLQPCYECGCCTVNGNTGNRGAAIHQAPINQRLRRFTLSLSVFRELAESCGGLDALLRCLDVSHDQCTPPSQQKPAAIGVLPRVRAIVEPPKQYYNNYITINNYNIFSNQYYDMPAAKYAAIKGAPGVLFGAPTSTEAMQKINGHQNYVTHFYCG